MKKPVMLLVLLISFLTGCTNEKEQLVIQNELLNQENKDLKIKIDVLEGINKNLEGYLKKKTDENNELYNKLGKLDGFTVEHEDQFIFDKRIELEALAVILSHFESANKQNEEQFNKTILKSENSSLYSIWNQVKEGKKVILKKVEFYNKDDVGRPRYLLTVYYDDKVRGMPLLKYEDGWKIADID